ncbi:MAG: isoquinoline 1-oxidoreductase [Gammaproteobacteria bacterium]|nr:MAG: isoquinoline 1-oxidoreductase [Gammaproteobacteria bacterium]
MGNRFSQLLKEWYEKRDSCQWVLGTVYKTHGPCYRKAGAMMLFSSDGPQFGLLSGGCLESDIQQHAKRVMQSGRSKTICYDSTDEDDLSFQLGIGCGGVVHILLQPVLKKYKYLCLTEIHQALLERRSGVFFQLVPDENGEVKSRFLNTSHEEGTGLIEEDGEAWLKTEIKPDPHLLVIGGGHDARPVVSIAHELGWFVSLYDSRPANARREYFMTADKILRTSTEELSNYAQSHSVDAGILMSHNIQIDMEALRALQSSPLKYLALIGPINRRKEVLDAAGLTDRSLQIPLASPAGLDLGAELPETIALSILAECHASLKEKSARSLSKILTT